MNKCNPKNFVLHFCVCLLSNAHSWNMQICSIYTYVYYVLLVFKYTHVCVFAINFAFKHSYTYCIYTHICTYVYELYHTDLVDP